MSVNPDCDRKYLRSIDGLSKITCLVSSVSHHNTRHNNNLFFPSLSPVAVRLHRLPVHRVQFGEAEQFSGLLLHRRRCDWLRADAAVATLPPAASWPELELQSLALVALRAGDAGAEPLHCLRPGALSGHCQLHSGSGEFETRCAALF